MESKQPDQWGFSQRNVHFAELGMAQCESPSSSVPALCALRCNRRLPGFSGGGGRPQSKAMLTSRSRLKSVPSPSCPLKLFPTLRTVPSANRDIWIDTNSSCIAGIICLLSRSSVGTWSATQTRWATLADWPQVSQYLLPCWIAGSFS